MPSAPLPASPITPPPPRAQDFAAVRDWPGYFRAVLGKPPRETLLWALDRIGGEPRNGERTAVDLGCGEGRDTLELLRRGWRVVAIDGHPDAFTHLRARVEADSLARLETRVATFEMLANEQTPWWSDGDRPKGMAMQSHSHATRFPPTPPDLINASFALPFCPPGSFNPLWDRIVRILAPDGRFAGQLFGDRDSWATIPDRSHHAAMRVAELLRPFEIEYLREEEKDDADAQGNPKHWHVFHIVARKRADKATPDTRCLQPRRPKSD